MVSEPHAAPLVGVQCARLGHDKRSRELDEDKAEDWVWERTGERAWEKGVVEDQEVSSDEDCDHIVKPKKGAGLWGSGPPLASRLLGKRQEFADGFGLCSPGRWEPHKRQCAASMPCLGFAEQLGVELLKILRGHLGLRALAMKLAVGRVDSLPFSDELVSEGQELLFTALELAGSKLPVRVRPDGQPFHLAAIEEYLRISGDPDSRVFYSSSDSFAKGVRVGPNAKLPRVPAVFDKKTKWRQYKEEEGNLDLDRENYLSAREHANLVQQQFEAEAALGCMVEMPLDVAKRKFGEDLALASLGAISKKDGSVRVIHDGTHGVRVNPDIVVRDQLRTPTAGDLQTVLQALPGAWFGLSGDVARAHRLVRVAEADWGLLACKTGVRPDRIWINTVGTFGIGSAAYHWSRLMSGIGRAVYYLLGRSELFMLVYVDDLLWIARDTSGIDKIILTIYFMTIVGLPFAWKKFRGGVDLAWVGFEICLKGSKLGLSAARSQWLIKWLSDAADVGRVRVADMSAVLGRLSFGLTALGHLRPFLGPVYAWTAAMTGKVILGKLPKAIIVIFRFLAKALAGGGRLASVPPAGGEQMELFRTDARAEGNEIWIGGWAMDSADTKRCRWFSEKLDHTSAPWLFTAGESYRQIASLELLATLAAIVVFGVPLQVRGRVRCSAGTDNKGNSHVVARLLTTKFPLVAFLMELAMQLQMVGADLELYWLPRLQNQEADALTNNDLTRFDAQLRLRFDLTSFKGLVLSDMLTCGTELYEEIRVARQRKVEHHVQRVRKSDTLKVANPWG